MITQAYNKIRELYSREHDRLILFVPVIMAMGDAWYFNLSYEPTLWLGGAFLATGIVLRLFVRKPLLRLASIAIILFACGILLAQYRTYSMQSPILAKPLAFATVHGTLAEITATPKGSKILLTDVTIDKVAPQDTPANISLTLRNYDPTLVTGEHLSLRAGLFPPPDPALPGGFDFRRHFYFQKIGAVGYGMPPITITSLKDSGASHFSIWFSEFRHALTESIRSHFHEPAGAVAAAFITGETRTIPDEINNDMRIAGLYHLLAVSGMNLSVVAGLAFFSLRLLLATIPAIALRYPIKKWAAVLAFIVSYIYLRVSGSPVSAERAFFMVSLVFIAIMLDRDPAPMRAVAFAAFCLIIAEPESVLSSSFQLSFSATAALIASYEWGTARFAATARREKGFGIRRVALYFAAVIATSGVAWLATEPFIIYHFNQFSSYSLISNTIAEPLVSFILMPLVIAGVLLMPLGLSWLAFTPMQYGVDALLFIARYVAHLPHAMWIVPNPSDAGFMAIVLGAIWIFFFSTQMRWLGGIGVILGIATTLFYTPADIFISSDAKQVAVRLDDGELAMVKGKNTTLNAQQWLHASIQQEFQDNDDNPATCDAIGCVVKTKHMVIALPKQPEALLDDCRLADIIITNEAVDRTHCAAHLIIDETTLASGGGVALWLKNHTIRMDRVNTTDGIRPWNIRSAAQE